MNVNMERIKVHYVFGHIGVFGRNAGWRFYPIQYEGNKYTVEIKGRCCNHGNVSCIRNLEYDIEGRIYQYSENDSLFQKHKSKKLYCRSINDMISNITKVQKRSNGLKVWANFDSDEQKTFEEKFLCCYPSIIRGLFDLYDSDKSKEQKLQEDIQEARKWDGVVK